METKTCCSLHDKTVREDEKKHKLINRLNRIEGQIRGIKKMLEDDVYCTDILTQSAAVSSAIDAFNRQLLEEHIKGCVVRDVRDGKYEVVDELMDIIKRLM
ncbi:MAG: metal-sensing transcriptional repressor [Clostridia bacterium]|nr:metal-sensing transcriptional repressor [Clostridia bacterium]MBR5633043.1 metal-sensing transcriptional repressor [Clostridia bacterium]